MSSDALPSSVAVSARGAGKAYRIFARPQDRLAQALWRRRKQTAPEFWALRDVSFDVPAGKAFAIIGRNGSGKSTLLQLIAGTLTPTCGEIRVRGRVAALLELGSGFNPDFTGRENVLLNGAILGIDAAKMRRRLDGVQDFAEIGDFFDRPVKTYSSGMCVRLAFAAAAHVDADILIVDEALAVGDVYFQSKCMQYLKTFLRQGGTLLFVSHAMDMVIPLADEAILLEQGRIESAGTPTVVSKDYARLVTRLQSEGRTALSTASPERAAPGRRAFLVDSDVRYGTRQARVESVELLDADGAPSRVFAVGAPMTVRVEVQYQVATAVPAFGIDIKLPNDLSVFVSTTLGSGQHIPPQPAGATKIHEQHVTLRLLGGKYVIALGVGELCNGQYVRHDRLHHAVDFEVLAQHAGESGIAHLSHRLEVRSPTSVAR